MPTAQCHLPAPVIAYRVVGSPEPASGRRRPGARCYQEPPPPPPPPPPEKPPPEKPLDPLDDGADVRVPALVTAKPSIALENSA